MYEFKIKVGDPSNDGHGKCETHVLICNKTTDEIEQAYLRVCELTGLVFSEDTPIVVNGSKISWQHPEYDMRQVCVGYQSYEPSELALEILSKYNISYDEDGDFVELFMNFIKIDLTDLEYSIKDDKIKTLNISIGYGIFD